MKSTACYFTLDEILALEQIGAINVEVAQRALSPDRRLLDPKTLLHNSGATYTLFVG